MRLSALLCGFALLVFTPFAVADEANIASLRISGGFPEKADGPGLFGEIEKTLPEMVRRLDRAANDDDIKGVVLKLRGPNVGRGKIAEIRAAIKRIRDAGKPVVAELESAMPADYMIASACDTITMPESGILALTGIRAEITYYKGLFDLLGVQADMLQVGDFKGAAEPYTRDSMSPEFRKQFSKVIDDFYLQMIENIAKDRGLKADQVRSAIDIGLLTPSKAKELGLIDQVAYADELPAWFAKKIKVDSVAMKKDYGNQSIDTDFSGMFGMIKMFELILGQQAAPTKSDRKKVAVVFATGPIMPGESTTSLFGLSTVGSDTIVKALRKAAVDESVVSIVLRVDSPGGSALASDLMWREIQRIKKPIYASMGDTAASGGYYISMGCDKIFAEPGTLTGSIGVVGGKVAIKDALSKVGVKTDTISRGKNADIFSMMTPFSDSERKAFRSFMVETYDQFTTKAAQGRGMKKEELEKLAGGKLWSGRMAKEVGLVDEIGTLRDALLAAKIAGGLKADEKAEIIYLPKPLSIFDALLAGPDAGAQMRDAADQVAPGAAKRLAEVRALQQMFSEPGVFMMPFFVKIR